MRQMHCSSKESSGPKKAEVPRFNEKMLGSRKRTKSLPPADSTSRIRFKEYFVMTEEKKEKVKK
jgi:hypothetical protein